MIIVTKLKFKIFIYEVLLVKNKKNLPINAGFMILPSLNFILRQHKLYP